MPRHCHRTPRHARQWRCCLLHFGVPPGLRDCLSSCLGRLRCGCTPGPCFALERPTGPGPPFPSVQCAGARGYRGHSCFRKMTVRANAHVHASGMWTLAHVNATPARGLERTPQMLSRFGGAGAGDASRRRAGGMRSVLGAPDRVSGQAGTRCVPAGSAQAGRCARRQRPEGRGRACASDGLLTLCSDLALTAPASLAHSCAPGVRAARTAHTACSCGSLCKA